MSWNLGRLVERIELDWPLDQAESWDNPGLSLGDPAVTVSKVLLSVDVTPEVIEEAAANSAELIISHHPVIFKPINSIAGFGSSQLVLQAAIASRVALYSAHTNVDFISGGVTDSLVKALSIEPESVIDLVTGAGSIGQLPRPISLREFAGLVSSALPRTPGGVLVQGDADRSVSTVAVLAGAGDTVLDLVTNTAADVFVTSDLRHHRALDFRTATMNKHQALVCISHWAAESLWLPAAARALSRMAPELTFVESTISTDPWTFRID